MFLIIWHILNVRSLQLFIINKIYFLKIINYVVENEMQEIDTIQTQTAEEPPIETEMFNSD